MFLYNVYTLSRSKYASKLITYCSDFVSVCVRVSRRQVAPFTNMV